MCLSQSNLFDLGIHLALEVAHMDGHGRNFAHGVLVKHIRGQSELTNISSSPHIQVTFICHHSVVVTTRLSKDHSLRVQAASCHKLRLCVTGIVSVSEAARSTISPGNNISTLSNSYAVLKAAAQPLDLARGKAIENGRGHQFDEKLL